MPYKIEKSSNRWARKKYRRIKDFLNQYKEYQGCQKCEEKDVNCLVFHHINKEDKKFDMSRAYKYSLKRIKEEIKRCEVLCHNCHNILHANETKTNLLEQIELITEQMQKESHLKMTKLYRKLHRKKTTLLNRLYIRDYKNKKDCKICKEQNPFCLVFHHKNKEDKISPVHSMAKNGIKSVKREIAKCEILCSNCHTKHHFAA